MRRCGVFVLLALLSVSVTHGRQMAPFIDPSCLENKDCSWHWQTTTLSGTQICETIFHLDVFDLCPNPFDIPDDFDNNDRPAKAESITVKDISKNFISETGALEQYTCLNIAIVIDPTSASKVKGIQLLLQGKREPDVSSFLCYSMNFSSGLDFSSVEGHVITTECFCGLRPNRDYDISVTTMPVDSRDGVYVTTEVVNHSTTDCNHVDKINDARCYKSEEVTVSVNHEIRTGFKLMLCWYMVAVTMALAVAKGVAMDNLFDSALWEPDCVLVEQNHTTGFYNLFDFSFNVAPSHYKFDEYQFFITPIDVLNLVAYHAVYMSTATVVNKTCSQSDNSMPFVTFSSDTKLWEMTSDNQFQARVKPRPTDDVCLDEQNSKIDCKSSQPQTFIVLSDPCTDNPCGVNGSCISNVNEYICKCDPGFFFDITCKVDPCKILDIMISDTYVSQCQNGDCIIYAARSDFYCQCNANFVANTGEKKCLANPCAIVPETNTTFCGEHGKCDINITIDAADGSCQCDPGYTSKKSKTACTKEENQIPVVIGATVTSCLFGIFLFLTVIFIYQRCQKKKIPDKIDHQVAPPGLYFIKKKKRVLPIYSDDHPLHNEVVVKFCRFLQKHCQCDVSLMEWEKSIGPTVEMWLTNQIEEADVVLLICSKGTGLKYMAKAKKRQMDSPGVYGDVFVKALFLLEDYFSRDNACNKFVVTYFDYTSEDDIPVPFRRFAKYKLMQSMEALYLRIHSEGRESPTSSRRVIDMDESKYPKLEMGKWLYEAIEAMKRLVKSHKKWYHKPDSNRNMNGRTAISSDNEQPFIDPYVGNTDSAYRTGDLDEPEAPSSFFVSDDNLSNGQGSNFEESLKSIQNRVPEPPNPIMTDPEVGYSQNLNSMEVPSNGILQRPYCIANIESTF